MRNTSARRRDQQTTARLGPEELRAWQALLHAHQRVFRQLDSELRDEHGLSMGMYDVLLRLARAPQRTLRMTELAQRVMMSPSGLTRLVDQLVRDRFVSRQRSKDDARVMLVRLTPKGRSGVRNAARTHFRGIREHFTGKLSPTQLGAIASALEAIAGPHEPH